MLGWSYAGQPFLARAILVLGPIILWLVALVIVWFASDLQVARPVRRLARAAEDYSRGDLTSRPVLKGPAELQDLATIFSEMATTIAGREQELREAIERVRR